MVVTPTLAGCGGCVIVGAGTAAGTTGAGIGTGGFGGEGFRSGGGISILWIGGLSFRNFGFCGGEVSSRLRLAADKVRISTCY
jgi:hypothetical protein